MLFFIARHGEAHHGFPDSDRRLTDHGVNELNKAAQARRAELKAVVKLIHSPLTRAIQSADCLKPYCSDNIVESCYQHIQPGSSVAQFLTFANEELLKEPAMIVSHQPFVSDLVEALTGEEIRITTGTLVCLDVDAFSSGFASLQWVQRPKF